jgi:hypothetical protein
MLVYGDQSEQIAAGDQAARVAATGRAAGALPAGLARHAALVEALIEAGKWLQGVADAQAAERGHDALTPEQVAGSRILRGLATAVLRSWTSRFEAGSDPSQLADGLQDLSATMFVGLREPEGYAIYGLYPEGYGVAAARSGLSRDTLVVGLRSIGTSLAAMVSAGLAAAPPVTLRPGGHPFDRRISPCPRFAGHLADRRSPFVAIVDEGPGLSGSSFGCVADWLEDRGRPASGIVAFAGHGGDLGPHASSRHRGRWRRLRRPLVPAEDLVGPAAPFEHRVETWLTDLLGPLEGPAVEISGGAWRDHAGPFPGGPPPAQAGQERRKILVKAGGARWLARFAGLGALGRRKHRMALELAEAGFGPPVAGLRHGFLVERWLDDTTPIDPAGLDRMAFARHAGRLIGFRARSFAVGGPIVDRTGPAGASLGDLLAMARHNVSEVLGPVMAARLDRWTGWQIEELSRLVRPIAVDGRMQPWEWRRRADGSLVKTDAVDHHAGHDLVGCQDAAWDVAGALLEWDLGAPEADALLRSAAEHGAGPIAAGLLALMVPCYAAFQLGAFQHAADMAGDEAERARLSRRARHYISQFDNRV